MSKVSSSRAGFKSIEAIILCSFSFFSIFSTLFNILLPLKTIGPVSPKCANNISPKLSYITFPLSIIFSDTFFNVKPCSSLQILSSLLNGTSPGLSSVIFSPFLCKMSNALPSLPVVGYDFPPVAIITLSARISPLFVFIPLHDPFSIIKSSKVVFNSTFTLLFFKSLTNASTTSCALSDTGNILPPRSSFVATPKDSIYSTTSLFEKFIYALYINLSLCFIFSLKSSISPSKVILHLPFPVILILFPRLAAFSISIVSFPSLELVIAASIPLAPPPTTTTFILFS